MKNRILIALTLCLAATTSSLYAADKPNIIMMMCDDLGYGDTGFNGHKIIKTPALDAMAKAGVKMTHFYAGGPVCSPTRGTCLTGRHHFRYGVFSANVGHLPKQEVTISEILKERGYTTGHFGKWHLGTLNTMTSAKGPRRKPEVNFSAPWHHGYDTSFVVESAVATWDPGDGPRAKNNPFYENGKVTKENLKGGAARVVMDRVIPFIENAKKEGKPFLAVIWFNAPHTPVVAGPGYLKMYEGHGNSAHYYGCITELDEQVGRLQAKLKELGIHKNTVQFFTSDNGPEGKPPKPGDLSAGSAGPFSGRKRDIYDGGVRVPTLTVWPGHIEGGTVVDVPTSTLDYLPTIAKVVGAKLPNRPLDGIDMMPIMKGEVSTRSKSILFRYGNLGSLIQGKHKLISNSVSGEQDVLYDLSSDIEEKKNIITAHPELAAKMKKELLGYLESCKNSHGGGDYESKEFRPVGAYRKLSQSSNQKIAAINNVKNRDKKPKKDKKKK
jgi:arylsulfatase A-like enzyme